MNSHLIYYFFLLISFFLPKSNTAQVTFTIEQIPDYTPIEDTIYITGNFNNWKPGDKDYAFSKQNDGTYTFTFINNIGTFDYKFTRGDWTRVESGLWGTKINNRTYIEQTYQIKSKEVKIKILGWEDLKDKIPFHTLLPIQVKKLPSNTPPDASIYITGNFNGWLPGDPNYKLEKQDNGDYLTYIPAHSDTLEFKFTRGNWATVEGRSSGRARTNRAYMLKENYPVSPIEINIETWEDLSGRAITFYTFLLLMAVCQGLLLITAINTIQDNNESSNRFLSLLILLMSLALAGRVAVYDREIFNGFPQLLLLPDLIYFLYGPLFLLYIRELLTIRQAQSHRVWLHFIPFVIHIGFYIPLFFTNQDIFIEKVVNLSFKSIFVVVGGLALLFNIFYWYKCRRLIRAFANSTEDTHSFEQNLQYLSTVIKLKAVCLGVWILTYLIGGFGWISGQNVTWLTDLSTDTIWIIFSLIVYCLGYFAMQQPEIFKLKEQEIIEKQLELSPVINPIKEHKEEVVEQKMVKKIEIPTTPKIEKQAEIDKEILIIKNQLEQLMSSEKPYLNPRLTLADLAERTSLHTHTLSKAINEGFKRNFFDFVNTYRVEEFQRRVLKEEYKNQTFLSIALSVGFNSKTAFNRAFKKSTQMTPRQYLKAASAVSGQ